MRRQSYQRAVEQFVKRLEHLGEGPAADFAHDLSVEAHTGHGGGFNERAHGRRKAVDPRDDGCSDPGRNGGSDVTRAAARSAEPLAQEFGDEQRVAVARGEQVAREMLGAGVMENALDQHPHVGGVERAKGHVAGLLRLEAPHEVAQRMMRADFLFAKRRDDEDRLAAQPPHERIEQFDRGSTRPMQIFEHDEQRPLLGHVRECGFDRIEEAPAVVLRGEFRQVR